MALPKRIPWWQPSSVTPPNPRVAVLLTKAAGCGLGLFAWTSGRTRLLRRANLFFAVCVGWNLLAIARS